MRLANRDCDSGFSTTPKEKAPALSGRGSAVSAGGGEGMPITAGGYGQNVSAGIGFPKKNATGEGDGVQINETPRMRAEAFRRQLPLQATISRPRLRFTPKRRFGKAAGRAFPRLDGARRAEADARLSLTIVKVWTGAAGHANLLSGQNEVGASRALVPLSIWGINRDSLREVVPGRRVRAFFCPFSSEMLEPDCSCHRKSGRNVK